MASEEQVVSAFSRFLLYSFNYVSFQFLVCFIQNNLDLFLQGYFGPRISVGKRVRSCSSFGILCTNPGFTFCY